MILRILTALALASPNALYYTWLATEFSNFTDIINNKLALTLFVEMTAATFLAAYLFWAKPIGNVRLRWFFLVSTVGGVGLGVPMFYWLNKQGPAAARTLRAKRRAFNAAKKQRREAQAVPASALILREQSV